MYYTVCAICTRALWLIGRIEAVGLSVCLSFAFFFLYPCYTAYVLNIVSPHSFPLHSHFPTLVFCPSLSTAFFPLFDDKSSMNVCFVLPPPRCLFFHGSHQTVLLSLCPVDPLYTLFSAGASFNRLDSHINGFLQINNSQPQYMLTYTYAASFPT